MEVDALLREGVGAALVVHLQPGLLVDRDVHVEGDVPDRVRTGPVQPVGVSLLRPEYLQQSGEVHLSRHLAPLHQRTVDTVAAWIRRIVKSSEENGSYQCRSCWRGRWGRAGW